MFSGEAKVNGEQFTVLFQRRGSVFPDSIIFLLIEG